MPWALRWAFSQDIVLIYFCKNVLGAVFALWTDKQKTDLSNRKNKTQSYNNKHLDSAQHREIKNTEFQVVF